MNVEAKTMMKKNKKAMKDHSKIARELKKIRDEKKQLVADTLKYFEKLTEPDVRPLGNEKEQICESPSIVDNKFRRRFASALKKKLEL
jgi:hypothetical protein